jgi:hypothetical protein
MDAILEHDPKRAAQIVRSIREEHGATVNATPEFSQAVREVPQSVRDRYFELLEGKPSRSPGQAEYERRELAEAHQRLTEIERAPLAERKEAAAEFLAKMRDYPEIVAERVGWLLGGNYGYGQMLMAKRILGSPRMNRSAALSQMVAAFEWQSPSVMTRAAWKKLTKGQQAALEAAVQTAIKDAESE